MFVPIPDVATVELVHNLFDRPCEVTLHFFNNGAPMSSFRLASLANRVGFWWADQVLPSLSWDLHFLYARATDQTVPFGDTVSDATFAAAGGTVRNAMPASVTAVIQFWAAVQSNVTRNRNYIPGLPDTSVVGNRLELEWMGNVLEGYRALIDQAAIVSWIWVGVHRFEGDTPLDEGTFAAVVRPRWLRYTVGQRRKRVHNSFDP